MRVFIVEDSKVLQDRITQRFAKEKKIHVIGFASEANSAIEQIQQLKPDVTILDIRLRQGNGFQVLQAVKTFAHSPVMIVLTNFPYPQYRQKFLANGADYFFDKSTEFDQAVALIEKLSRRRKSNRPAADVPPHVTI